MRAGLAPKKASRNARFEIHGHAPPGSRCAYAGVRSGTYWDRPGPISHIQLNLDDPGQNMPNIDLVLIRNVMIRSTSKVVNPFLGA